MFQLFNNCIYLGQLRLRVLRLFHKLVNGLRKKTFLNMYNEHVDIQIYNIKTRGPTIELNYLLWIDFCFKELMKNVTKYILINTTSWLRIKVFYKTKRRSMKCFTTIKFKFTLYKTSNKPSVMTILFTKMFHLFVRKKEPIH